MDSNNMREFIESGILEAYVTGTASKEEEREVLYMKKVYPEVAQTLNGIEADLEELARHMAIAPPPDLWSRIEGELNELIPYEERAPHDYQEDNGHSYQQNFRKKQDFIEVEFESTHMRVHKAWKWVFAAVFVLGKIFLGTAIYFYLENRQVQENIKELKQQLKVERGIK